MTQHGLIEQDALEPVLAWDDTDETRSSDPQVWTVDVSKIVK
jgi:hypothetical protein